jgi:lipopolysaccharide transport system permease protein
LLAEQPRRSDLVVETETQQPEPATRGETESLDRWFENRPASRWGAFDLPEIWAYRELGWTFAVKDLKVRYKQTFFGVAWVLLQPLLAVLIFSVIFGRLAGLPTDGLPYPVFSYAGMTIWLYFSAGVIAAAQSLVGNRDLVSKVYFPRVLAPTSAIVPGLVDLAISLVVLAVFMAVYGVAPGPAIVLLPFWVLFAAGVTLATGLWLAALNVEYRDVKYVLSFLIQVWLFASPVVYSSSLIPQEWQYVYALNPMVGVLDGFRWSAAGAPAPGPEVFVSLAVAAILLVTGGIYFRKVESYFSDLI